MQCDCSLGWIQSTLHRCVFKGKEVESNGNFVQRLLSSNKDETPWLLFECVTTPLSSSILFCRKVERKEKKRKKQNKYLSDASVVGFDAGIGGQVYLSFSSFFFFRIRMDVPLAVAMESETFQQRKFESLHPTQCQVYWSEARRDAAVLD